MTDFIPTPKISEILWEEFMEPMGISAYKLAQAIHVPVSRIQDILHAPTTNASHIFCMTEERFQQIPR